MVLLKQPNSNFAARIRRHKNFEVVKNYCSKVTSVVLSSNSLAQALKYNRLSLDARMEFKCYFDCIRDVNSDFFQAEVDPVKALNGEQIIY